MKYFLSIFTLLVISLFSNAQNIYTKTFGNSKNEPIIFIHGGPGSSSLAFGISTAQRLADSGFYVITYDRRGEGLSTNQPAKYTFQQTFDDLNSIYKKFNIRKATIIGFSFGGIVSTLYAEKYPSNVKSLVLVSSLLSQPETYQTILDKSKKIYETKNDTANLKDIIEIQKMNVSSFEYRARCFKHSSKNGFFATKNQNDLAKSLYAKIEADTSYLHFMATKNDDPVKGFWKNENYSTMSIVPVIKSLRARNLSIYALYGKDDGLFSIKQIEDLQNIVGKKNLKYLDNSSHYLYTDQQDKFITALKLWLK